MRRRRARSPTSRSLRRRGALASALWWSGAGRDDAPPSMTLLLDAGALIAVEHGDRDVIALIKREQVFGRLPVTHGGVVGQVWRGGSRQANLARLLAGTDVAPLDDALGRRAGALLHRARRADVVDAALLALAADGDEVLTSDAEDLRALASAAGLHVDLVPAQPAPHRRRPPAPRGAQR